VHFLDDDVVLAEGYFEGLEKCFLRDRQVLGAGPAMDSEIRRSANWHDRLFLRDSNIGGRVLASGVNVLPRRAGGAARVDWLSGCGMSYRTSVFERVRFDESLEGYCLGEDVAFSYRVGKMGKLVVTQASRLEHRQSAVDRLTADAWTRQALAWRHAFVSEHRREGLSLVAFWWSVVGELVFSGALHGLAVRKAGLSHVAAVTLGVRDVVRGPHSEGRWWHGDS
jgi:GT2 family glycosyltransferase